VHDDVVEEEPVLAQQRMVLQVPLRLQVGATRPWRDPIELFGMPRKMTNVISVITATSRTAHTSRRITKTSKGP